MLVPRNTDSIALSSLIGAPYNYWGDDDGDGQGIDGVTATGSLKLSIVNKWNLVVARNEVLDICRAPYKLTLSNDGGILKTRYGVPNESRFSAGNATYYINPNPNISSPVICFAIPLSHNNNGYIVPASIWDWHKRGFLTQSVTPSSYGSNFPTTGANNLYFDLDIVGNNQALSWAPVSHGGITATMTDSTSTSVRVTLTGPVATPSQWQSENPYSIGRLSLPQTFELVGRDSSGNAVVKYGFKLKQWFVNRGPDKYTYSSMNSWCNNIGYYRVPKVKDLTNANCDSPCQSARPSPWVNYSSHHIGAGFFTEWGRMDSYRGANFKERKYYWTRDNTSYNALYTVDSFDGNIYYAYRDNSNNSSSNDFNKPYQYGLCVYP
ncbi:MULTISPECIES: hypothetical protein [unclassified Gilliamella]|uniref:hypothetical protein n=1 Tax=unclassified Gilliamella TaxID=2685620 RepID=UPI0018DC8D4A|nr:MULTISPECIES: hypothetical protein [unclassified Gilliamella]MBI0113081.1 hypothetical protein [Gilliamella sp. W8123]MBI0116711.1 hypothetical protein [Gilliamella sp. W8129]